MCQRNTPSLERKEPGDVLWLDDIFYGNSMYGVTGDVDENFSALVLRGQDGAFLLTTYNHGGGIKEEVVLVRYDGPRDDLVPGSISIKGGRKYIAIPRGNGMTLEDGTIVDNPNPSDASGGTLVMVRNTISRSKVFVDLIPGSAVVLALDEGFVVAGMSVDGSSFVARMDDCIEPSWSITTMGKMVISGMCRSGNGILVVGTFQGAVRLCGHDLCGEDPTPWVAQISGSGEVQWLRSLSFEGTGNDVVVNGDIYIVGVRTCGDSTSPSHPRSIVLVRMDTTGATEIVSTFLTNVTNAFETSPKLSVTPGGIVLSFYSFGELHVATEEKKYLITRGTGLADLIVVGVSVTTKPRIRWISVVVGAVPGNSRPLSSDERGLYLVGTHAVSLEERGVFVSRLVSTTGT